MDILEQVDDIACHVLQEIYEARPLVPDIAYIEDRLQDIRNLCTEKSTEGNT
jgi:hypothetical protein